MKTGRSFLQVVLLILVTVLFGTPLQAQSMFSTVDLGDGLTLVTGAGANVVVAEGPDAVVIVDGGSREHADTLLAEISRLTANKPVAALFNTNWRPDRTGLNHLLGAQGVPIIAHENTRLWQSVDIDVAWAGHDYPALPKEAQASTTFYTTGSMMLGNEKIEYGFISQASTDGDIYVQFANADVLVVGDMLAVGAWPVLDYVTGGWIGGAQKATAGLIELAGEGTKVVASTGAVQGLQDIREQAAMLEHAYGKVAEAFKTGRSLEQFRDSNPMEEYVSQRGDPALFLQLLYRGTWYHVPARAVPGII
jgi:cyclase